MNIRFRGKRGGFIKAEDRYSGEVATVEAKRRGKWIKIIDDGNVTPERLAQVTNRKEFEQFPPAFEPISEFTSKSKYQIWDLAEQIDRSKGIRRKLIRVTLEIKDGKRRRKVSAYLKINRNQKSSYRLFQRMNDVLGANGMFVYDRFKGRLIEDRKGKKIKIVKAVVEEVI